MRVRLGSLTGLDPVPAASYVVTLVKVTPTDFETSVSWGFKVQFKVAEGEFENRTIFENYVVLDKNGDPSPAIFRFAQFVTACMGDIEIDLSDSQECQAAIESCLNQPVKVKVDVENDNKGLPRNRISGYEA